MRLEDQEPDASVVTAQVDEIADDLVDSPSLWATA